MLNDNSVMTFGVHKDKKLIDVPARYLLWMWNEWKTKLPRTDQIELQNYIQDNIEVLQMEQKREARQAVHHYREDNV